MIFKIGTACTFAKYLEELFLCKIGEENSYDVKALINASRWWRLEDGVGKFGSFKHCWTQLDVQSRYSFDRVNNGIDNVSTKWRGLAPPTH
jgi:hypothetical protein